MEMNLHKLLWNILFSNQKSGVSGVFCDMEPLVPFFPDMIPTM